MEWPLPVSIAAAGPRQILAEREPPLGTGI
jgi:hypothetical protein